ncbi:hypothetical protein [Winogradskya consettensis]|nr:hypothetical protein [Actinoplanes consettensis]
MTTGLGLVLALATSLTFAGPASAADGVDPGRCYNSSTSLGTICVFVTYDNTNCDAFSTDNCVGLNGATVRDVEIRVESGAVDTLATLMISYDVYGDGTSDYTRKGYAAFRQTSSRDYLWSPSTAVNDVNRLCVRVRSASAGSYDDGINIGGMNPYGLSTSGACNLP